jgi:uncharacterized Ntn-hydrolase superfamily protein
MRTLPSLRPMTPGRPRPSTFSVVAADLERKEWGVAVQSKFIGVGAVVPWAQATIGAIATQALANMGYGPDGLALLKRGLSAEEVVHKLTLPDKQREDRQVGVVDARGRAASYTGKKCMEWAGHVVGEGFTCQGNILLSPDVVHAMAKAMESTPGDLADRLLAALGAGQKMGGDRRGQQSAALLVVKPGGSYGGTTDRYIDVRVDDHATPIEELRRVFDLYDLTLLERDDPSTLVPLEGQVAREVQEDLQTLGYYFGSVHGKWDGATAESFSKFLGFSNFENRERKDGTAWPRVLAHLHTQAREARERASKTQRPVYGALSAGPGRSSTAPGAAAAPASGAHGRSSKKRPG